MVGAPTTLIGASLIDSAMRRVVLLPGLDGTGTLFEDFVRARPPGVRLEVVPLPAERLTHAQLAERIAPTLRLDAHTLLLAESFSGPLAVMLAAREAVAALVLCNSFVVPPRAPLLRILAREIFFRAPPPASVVRRLLVGPHASDALVACVRAVIASVPPALLAARLRAVLSVNVAGTLARCTAPIVYLRGDDDRLVPEASVSALLAAAPTPVKLVRLSGPHLLLQASPEAAWRAIRDVVIGA